MDRKDRQIIRVLQENGRITNQELAERVNLSPSPCLRRVKNLERAEIIKGYGAQIEPRAYGLAITAFVSIRLERHDDETVRKFEREVARMPEVLDCYVMAGQVDYQLRVVVEDLNNYEVFVRERLQKIGRLASIDTRFAFGTVKETAVFPLL